MSKIVSQLDVDGYFLGPVLADESPLEPGVFLIPGGAVDLEPPNIPEGTRARPHAGAWLIEDVPAEPLSPPPPPPTTEQIIPQSVTMRQARLALLSAGFLEAVDAAISAMPDGPQRKAAQIEWEYAQTVDRASSFTQQLAAGLGLTDTQMDDLFTQAATL